MHKKLLALLMVLATTLSLFGCGNSNSNSSASSANESKFKAGTYTAMADGFGGEFEVAVTVDDNAITAITVGDNKETEGIGANAIATLPDQIINSQSLAVDAFSGATVTSKALFAAIETALLEGGADIEALKNVAVAPVEKAEDVTLDTDVVIIGAGGAGLTAAIEAKSAGNSVLIVEKMPMVGGNTVKGSGGMNASETRYQKEAGKIYTNDEFYDFTLEGGHGLNNPELLRYYVEHSSDAIDWLAENGMNYTFGEYDTAQKSHAVNDGGPIGIELMRVLSERAAKEEIEIMLDTKAEEILMVDGKAAGVVCTGKTGNKITINAKAVVLATGGFGANADMVTKYRADLKGYVTTNHPGATGDGIAMAEAVGASMTDIEQIQIHPTVEQNTSELVSESLRRDGSILINSQGKRFYNEILTRDKVSQAILEQEGSYAYIVFDQSVREVRKIIEKYIERGFVLQAETLEDLAKQMDVDAETFKASVEAWNTAATNKGGDEFGRAEAMERPLVNAPYYAIKIAPGIHHTMGGVTINTSAEVLNTSGDVIPGLFAAGEVTGGIHGGNRIGGNAITDIVVFGRVAGQQSAAYVSGK